MDWVLTILLIAGIVWVCWAALTEREPSEFKTRPHLKFAVGYWGSHEDARRELEERMSRVLPSEAGLAVLAGHSSPGSQWLEVSWKRRRGLKPEFAQIHVETDIYGGKWKFAKPRKVAGLIEQMEASYDD